LAKYNEYVDIGTEGILTELPNTLVQTMCNVFPICTSNTCSRN